jgi:MarR family transcriptional regulator for hemolysin
MAESLDLILLLRQAANAFDRELAAALAKVGISVRHYCVLSKALPGDRTQIRLAELSGLDKTTMVVTLDELEKAGLAERRPSPTDRRARLVAVTKAGKRVVAEGERVVAAVYDEILSTLPRRQRDAFIDALVTLVNGRLSTPPELEREERRERPAREERVARIRARA